MQIESSGQVATLIPEKRAPVPSPGAGTNASNQARATQTEAAVREPPSVTDPPRESATRGGVDIVV